VTPDGNQERSVATVHLVIDPGPDIDVTAREAVVEDVRDGSEVTFASQQILVLSSPVVGHSQLEVSLDGDPADGARTVEFYNRFNAVGAAGRSLEPCGHAKTTFLLSPEQLQNFTAGNRFSLGVSSQPTSAHKCDANRQDVVLRYPTFDVTAPLDFGQVDVGRSQELDLTVRNLGSQPLSRPRTSRQDHPASCGSFSHRSPKES
jgi:hypothetical protein